MGQITISVDLSNRAERAALVAFISTLDINELANAAEKVAAVANAAASLPADLAPAKTVKKKTETPKPEPLKPEEPQTDEASAAEPEPPKTEEPQTPEAKEVIAVTELELRRAVSEAVQRSAENRNKIKSEFERLGIPNLSALDSEKYEGFLAFLKSLA